MYHTGCVSVCWALRFVQIYVFPQQGVKDLHIIKLQHSEKRLYEWRSHLIRIWVQVQLLCLAWETILSNNKEKYSK